MRLRTTSDTQFHNLTLLLDTLPTVEPNEFQSTGPLVACDRGYGKMSLIRMLMRKHFKVITFAATLGSEHPFVTSSDAAVYREKLKQYDSNSGIGRGHPADDDAAGDDDMQPDMVSASSNSTEVSELLPMCTTVSQFDEAIRSWEVVDDVLQQLGPQVFSATNCDDECLSAVAIRDVFDSKASSKTLRFFMYGIPQGKRNSHFYLIFFDVVN